MTSRFLRSALSAVALAMVAAGCGAGQPSDAHGRVEVVAAFYPLEYAAEQIGGDRVQVSGLTKPGVEPHDLELTPKAVATLAQADTVVYLRGFQAAVDEAVAGHAKGHGLDVSTAARLDLEAVPESHRGESSLQHEAHSGTAKDPHFWLDPERYADVADAIATRLAATDPAHAEEYRARAADFTRRLDALDGEFRAGLNDCKSRELVTSHAAFAYLAKEYGLHQESISGLTPDSEPDPAALARIATFVKDKGVTTVYAETLASKAVAETLSRETGARLAVLDPIEGLTDESAGGDYFEVMRSNLATLREGQGCR